MNNKIKIVATAAISTMLIAGCSAFEEQRMGMLPPQPPSLPTPPSIESTKDDSDNFVNVDPVSPENTGEEVSE